MKGNGVMKTMFGLVLLFSIPLVLTSCQTPPQPSTAAVAPEPVAIEQLYQEGRAAYEAGDFTAAAEKFARVADADATNLNALINWGAALARGGQALEAISKYQLALARDPNNAAAYYNWGVALERLRKHAEAVEKYERAIALQSDLLTPTLQAYLERQRSRKQDTQISTPPPRK
jgi:tetratricopeptide (TPR) repeat protein